MIRSIMSVACVFVFLLVPIDRSSESSSNKGRVPDDQPQNVDFPFSGQGPEANDIHIKWKRNVHVREAKGYNPGDHPPGEAGETEEKGKTWDVNRGEDARHGNDTTEMTLTLVKANKDEPNLTALGNLRLKIDPLGGEFQDLVESYQWSLDGKLIGEEKRSSSTGGSGAAGTAKVATAGGLKVITFTTNSGTIKLNLPDDMRAGDAISGTVIAEPNGQTPEERATNEAKLREHVVTLTAIIDPKSPTALPPMVIFDLSKGVTQPGGSSIVPGTFTAPTKVNAGLFLMPNQNSPIRPCGRSGSIVAINESCSPISQLVFDVPTGKIITADPKITPPTHPSGAIITPDPKITPTFIIPPLGQAGRPIVITGPFDGNSSNTFVSGLTQRILNYGAVRTTVQDFEKNTENVSGGFGLIAESPRKAVFQTPPNFTGPIELNLKEGNVETKGTYRNVGVNLSAPKTDLLKGEKTTLTVQVNGLEGIKQPVPLTLECKGVITMEGGIYQPLVIQPSEVGADGRYTTTRGITGVQTGGWEATATVVTGRFNICLQDDAVPHRRLLWNTVTGDYAFIYPDGWPPKGKQDGGGKTGGTTGSGGATPPTGPDQPPTDPPTGLTGTGKMIMKGCIITLQHNAPDRRVFSRLDSCTTSGSSTVEDPKTKVKFTITDRSTADNTCQSQ